MTIDADTARRRLEAWREELLDQSARTSDDRAAVTLDQQSVGRLSRMDAMQQQAMAKAQQRARTADLARIDQALRRLADGEYGYCLDCGEEIPDKRLEIDPAASHCVACMGARS